MSDNPYLDAMKAAPAATGADPTAPGNPYLDALRDDATARSSKTSASITQALPVSPDKYATQRRDAKTLGFPPVVGESMPDQVAHDAKLKTVNQDIAEHPVLQRQYSDADFAKLAHDDSGTLSVLANSMKRGWAGLKELVPGAQFRGNANVLSQINAVETKMANGQPVLDSEDPYAVRFMSPQQLADFKQTAAGGAGRAAVGIAGLEAQKRTFPQPEVAGRVAAAKTFGGAVDAFLTDPVKYIASIGPESLVQNAPGLVAGGVLGKVVGPALGAATAGGNSFITDYNSTLLESLGKAGVDVTDSAALAKAATDPKLMQKVAAEAFAHAAVVGAVDAGSAGIAGKAALPAKALGAKPLGREIANMAIQTPVQGALGGLGELGGEVVAGQDIDPGNILAEIVGEGFGAPAEVATMAGGHVRERMQQAKAEASMKVLQEQFTTAAESKLRERAPDSFAGLVQDLADNTADAPKEVRFDARLLHDVLSQAGITDAQLETMLPSVLPQLREAMDNGGEVTVPMGEFTGVIGQPFEQQLLEHARIGDNELSQAEATTAGEQAAQYLKESAERVMGVAGENAAASVAAESVKTTILDQLNTAKRFTPHVNEAYATLVRDFYATLAGRTGMAADELYKKFPLTVQAEGVGPLDQPAYHGTPHTVDKFTTQKIGTGEGAQAYGWGMYFAGNKDIADFYRKTLAADGFLTGDGKVFDPSSLEHLNVKTMMYTGDLTGAIAKADQIAASDSPVAAMAKRDAEKLRAIEASGGLKKNEGNTYKVEVPEDSDMLDYDAAFKDQSPKVQAALAKLGFNPEVFEIVTPGGKLFHQYDTLQQAQRHIKAHNIEGKVRSVPNPITGKDVYAELEKRKDLPGVEGSEAMKADEAASKALLAAGIPGLRFLDAGSRGTFAKGETRNYVIFDDAHVGTPEVLNQNAVDEATGLPLNADGTVTVYHHTSAAKAKQIEKTGELKSAGEPDVYVTTRKETDTGYGDTAVPVRVDPALLQLDDEFPDGRRDYRLSTGKPGGSISVGVGELNQGQGKPRGTFNPETLSITLLEKADLSTFLHETGHFFLTAMADIASQPGAPESVTQDMQAVLDWFGVKSLNDWNVLSLEQQRQNHEKFAESFEQYLFEGKAPSADLQPVFQRFRSWLTNVYHSVSAFLARQGNNAHLTDEVRGVFDRMLASTEQIQQTEALNAYAPLFKSAAEAGMNPAQWAAYQAQGQQATADAIDKLQTRSIKDMRWLTNARSRALKALQKDVAAKRATVEKEASAELAKEPVYQAQRWLRKGEMTTPEGDEIKAEKGFRLNTEALAEMYPDSALDNPNLEKLKGMTAGNGLHPDLVAEMFGYSSGDQLVRAITDAEPLASAVEGLTDRLLLERFGDLVTERGVQRAADEAVHNEARGRFVATELRALAEAQGKTEKTARGGSVNTMVRAAKMYASQLISQRKVRELRPGQHVAAETRAAKASDKALRSGDTKAAIVAKRDQLLNHYAARETNAALAEVDKAVTYLNKFDKPGVRKNLPPEYLDQIDKLLERVDLRRATTAKESAKRATLNAWIKSQQDLGIDVELPAYVLEDAALTSYKEMPLEAFRGLVDSIKQIEHLGRLKDKLLTAKDDREFGAIKDDIVQSILANAGNRTANTRTPTTNLGRALQTVKNFGAAHIKAATWARVFDGGKDGGPVWEYFIRPANLAGDQEVTMRAKATKDLSEIMAPLLKEAALGGAGKFFPTINRSLNRESVLAIALNVGNAGNLQRLLGGENWNLTQLKPVLDTLSPQDWAAVQKIWDYFDSFRPLIGAKERRVFGKEPDWVEPGSDATELYKVKGGYYPIKYDPAASVRAEEHADAEGARRQLQGAYGAATTKRSFTKSRAEEVTGRPLLYTLSGVYSGVNDVIHDLAWHEWLIDTNRLLKSQSIDAAIRNKYGPEAVRQLKSWRDDIAEGESGMQSALDMGSAVLRQSVSVAGLGFNVVSAAMQPLGITQSIQRVGATWIGRGLRQFIAHPKALTVEVNSKSDFMANRSRTRFRELNELRNKVQGQSTAKRVMQENAYWLMMRCQQMVDVPTWQGAYEKAIAEGQVEDRAVDLADQAVIDSQGGGQTKDLSAIERGGPTQKLFTVFYSFMNTALNLGVTSKMTPKSRGKFVADMVLLYVVPAVLGSLLKAAITPGDSGDDEEAIAKKLAADQISYLMGLMVLTREFGAAANLIAGKPADYKGPAGVRAIADAMQFGKQAAQGEFDDSFRKAAINLAGDIFGLPSAQLNRTITGAEAMADGDTKNPAALVLGYQKPK